jgi:hypothetical protein
LSVGVRGGCSGECGGEVPKIPPEVEDAVAALKYDVPDTTCLRSPSPVDVGVSDRI